MHANPYNLVFHSLSKKTKVGFQICKSCDILDYTLKPITFQSWMWTGNRVNIFTKYFDNKVFLNTSNVSDLGSK